MGLRFSASLAGLVGATESADNRINPMIVPRPDQIMGFMGVAVLSILQTCLSCNSYNIPTILYWRRHLLLPATGMNGDRTAS